MKVFSKLSHRSIIVLSLITSIAITSTGVVFPFGANAQSVGPVVPTSDFQAQRKLDTVIDGIGYKGGIIGSGTIESIGDIRGQVSQICKNVIEQLGTTGGLDKFIKSTQQTPSFWQEIIGGGIGEASSASIQAQAIQKGLDCVNEYLNTLEDIEIKTLIHGQEVQREQAKFSEIATSMVQQLYALNARASASWKDVAKALMVRTLLSVNKNVTSNLANSFVQKYKIDDYLAYGDALATQVYAMKYIDQNFVGDARTQMMMRSLIQSEKVPEQARVAAAFANQQAKEYITNACGTVGRLDAQNKSSLNCLAAYGNEQSSPMFKYLNALDTSQKIKTEAQRTAQAEIAQSDGFAPPRDCSGSVSLQSQVDAEVTTTTKERDAAQAVLAELTNAFVEGQTTAAELAKAQTAYEVAEQKMADLPQKVSKPVVDICKAIDSPAKYLSNQIADWVGSLTKSASDLKPDNLPFYATFISDVASNFLTNLLTGGKQNSKIFKEAGVAALGAGIASVPALIGNSGSGTGTEFGDDSVIVYITPSGSSSKTTQLISGRNYVMNVDVAGYLRKNNNLPTRIEVRNTNTNELLNPGNTNSTSVNVTDPVFHYTFVAPTQDAIFSVTLLGSSGEQIMQIKGSFTVSTGTVSGVSTTNFNPRGSIVATFRPR